MNGVRQGLELFTIMFTMNCGMDYWVIYSFYCPASPQTKSKSMKKHRSRMTASTSREQMAITYNSLSALQPNKDFRPPFAWANTMIPRFNHWPLPSPRTRRVKKLTDSFKKCNFTQCVSMLYTENLYCTICSVFADPITNNHDMLKD